MPVNRLKLLAFALGAGVAGLTGTLFASLNTAVFAADFDAPLLITVYAMLILGGAGSLGGVILGALVVNVSLEALRTPNHATWIFYACSSRRRSSRSCGRGGGSPACSSGTIAFGFAVHAIARRRSGRARSRATASVGGRLGDGALALGAAADERARRRQLGVRRARRARPRADDGAAASSATCC